MIEVRNYINGKFVDTENTIEDINPATGDIIAHIPKSSSNEVLCFDNVINRIINEKV